MIALTKIYALKNIMKPKFLILIGALLFSTISQAQIFENKKSALLNVLLKQQSDWNNGNIKSFMNGYWKSDSLQFVGRKGITKGWQNTLDMYLKSYPDTATMGKLHFDILDIDLLSKNSAIVLGKWLLIREKSKGDLSGHFSAILKKINGHWVIVIDHTS